MKWHQTLIKTAGAPQYLQERVSDLRHAADLAKTAPREASRVLSHVVSQLDQHHDKDFIPLLQEAGKAMLDSPARAITVINHIVAAMLSAKEIEEEKREKNPWATQA
jgi:acyl-CoA reductase-like NAD-dependent aldehyde dehydrogenase